MQSVSITYYILSILANCFPITDDFVVLELDGDVPPSLALPICLPSADEHVNTAIDALTVAGWGGVYVRKIKCQV